MVTHYTSKRRPHIRKRIITVRHATPTRRKVVVIVVQSQDEMGNWMVPIITFEGFSQVILESGRFARDAGGALIVAAWFYEEWMQYVPHQNGEGLSDDGTTIT